MTGLTSCDETWPTFDYHAEDSRHSLEFGASDEISHSPLRHVHQPINRRLTLDEYLSGLKPYERSRTDSIICRPPPPVMAVATHHDASDVHDWPTFDVKNNFLPTFPQLSDEDVRRSLAEEVKKHRSWRMQAVKRMQISKINTSVALRYSLESFVEMRTTYDVCESYVGRSPPVDIENAGAVYNFNVWEIPCEPSTLFVEDEKQIELPVTSSIKPCSTCTGQGSSYCFHCRGSGNSRCNLCNGTGMKSGVPHPAVVTHPLVGSHFQHSTPTLGKSTVVGGQTFAKGTPMHFHSMAGLPPPGVTTVDLCIVCQGRGVKECYYCKGSGKKSCGLCGGSGKIRIRTRVKIKFSIESSEYVDSVGIPETLVKSASGDIIFAEMKARLTPIRGFPVEAVNDYSARLLQVHANNSIGRCKILQQRQMLEGVPVTQVDYALGGRQGAFWVVGTERKAYVPQYPQRCTIL